MCKLRFDVRFQQAQTDISAISLPLIRLCFRRLNGLLTTVNKILHDTIQAEKRARICTMIKVTISTRKYILWLYRCGADLEWTSLQNLRTPQGAQFITICGHLYVGNRNVLVLNQTNMALKQWAVHLQTKETTWEMQN